MFDAMKAKNDCVQWIRDFFETNGKDCNAICGISGGKDSSVVAALCVEALGKDRVIGVLMPNGEQSDISYAYGICEYLDIKHYVINIKDAFDGIVKQLENALPLTNQAMVNLAPRIRMSTLYAVSQCNNGRVANTCNLSEDWVGYSTRYGDSVGDFAPTSCFTVEEIKLIAAYLGIPEKFYNKVPSDGLCGKTDEDNLGFTYQCLDDYIRRGIIPEPKIKERIDYLHKINLFKLSYMPVFDYKGEEENE
jgi:NAD+ synthase